MGLRFATPAPGMVGTGLLIRHLLETDPVRDSLQEIVYRDRVRHTYADLRQRVASLAAGLAGLGVTEGSTVAILDWDSPRYLEHYFAVPMMGAVLMTANVRLSVQHLRHTLTHSRAEIVVVHEDFWAQIDPIRADLTDVRAYVVIAETSAERPEWATAEYEELVATPGAFQFRDFDENALATTFYTTGTTGLPKQVCFSHRQLVLHTLALGTALGARTGRGLRRSDVYMPLTPMFHVHAWGVPYLATMLGLKQVYPGRYEPEAILRLRQSEGVTFSHGVPTVLQMVLAAAKRSDADLEGWFMVIGGSALTRELDDAACAAGMTIAAGYGMSETGPVISIAEEGSDYASARAGTPIPLVSARVVDERMVPLEADDRQSGELVLRAPWLTPCYPGDEEASEALWRGGWLHTQDVATIGPDGSIMIRDRLKDVIKTGGEWISSLALEDIVSRHAAIAEVAVVGLPDPKWQERPVAAVVAATGAAAPGLTEVNALVDQAVAAGLVPRYARLDALHIRDSLPRTSVGKIDKKALRAELSAA